MSTIAYIALGSNLAEPLKQISQALQSLKKVPNTQLIACSSIYQSPPMAAMKQPDYLNAVAEIKTDLDAITLLNYCQAIEKKQGRTRTQKWAARTLDLDILLFGKQAIKNQRLTVPHYNMRQRDFVLIPLLEINPNLTMPNNQTIADLAQRLPQVTVQKCHSITLP